jgi:arylsulfatase A-like enzyme
MSTKPNILLIIIDHVAFAGHYGNTRYPYQWPRLEQFAKQGTWFDRAYCTTPICTPARASLMTGMRPSSHGLRWNSEYDILQSLKDFRSGQKLYSHHLSEQGYRNVFVGKWHCGKERLPQDYGMEGWGLPEYGNVYGSAAYKQYLAERDLEQPECFVEHNLLLPEEEQHTKVVLDPPNPWKYMEGCGVLEGPKEAHEQFFVANMVADRLEDLSKQKQPFCMTASFWGPHQPYFPSREFADLVNPEDIPEYPSWSEDLVNKPQRYRVHRDLRCDYRSHEKWPQWRIWQKVLARSYAQGLQTDAALGILFDKLDELGIAKDTLVLVTADHGDGVATHGGVWDKSSTFPEEVARIPMVVRWPGQVAVNQRQDCLVNTTDVTATMIAAAGGSADSIDGENLLQWCASDSTSVAHSQARDHLVCEHYGHSGDVLHQRIVYWRDWKYVAAYGDGDELYNLPEDPYELNNLIGAEQAREARQHCRTLLIADLKNERDKRAVKHPPSELEFMLVKSTARWPREERLLLHKLEHDHAMELA